MMTLKELGTELFQMYTKAENGYKVTSIYLFGIKYSNYIKEKGYSANDIIQASNLKPSFKTELSKALKLSIFVRLVD